MTDALDSYRYFHSALVKEARELATILGESLGDDRARVDAVAHRFAFFQQANAVHEAAEEAFLFPAIEKRAPHATDAFAFDHSSGERLYSEIADALDELRAAERDTPPVDLANALTRRVCALEQLLVLHSDKENELLVPIVEQSASEEEQRELMRGMFGQAGPDLGPHIVSWMFGHLSAEDRAGFLGVATLLFPRERLDAMVKALAVSVGPEEWNDVLERMPELRS